MPRQPVLRGRAFRLRLPRPVDVPRIVAFQVENREHFRPTDPPREPEYFTEGYWRERVEAARDDYAMDRGCRLFLFGAEGEVMGTVALSNIVRGAFQACHLGYGLARRHERQGHMSEAVRLAVSLAFGDLRLHRVMANCMPRNERSLRLLRRLGFVEEGLAREYLFINGRWEDHVLTSLTNAAWRAASPPGAARRRSTQPRRRRTG